ncbi:hypothetical protein [Acinetobacter brisouii]|uniref:hypothetical protein n=1 Tax=Acinetobacter brisouii TaxID=396323 RepID=UPI0005F78C5B|nr:hypothetical protein [Acinetobacter brisouii]KJV38548.1 hypothetical protein VH98_08945 [Acinetobacter brisouii]
MILKNISILLFFCFSGFSFAKDVDDNYFSGKIYYAKQVCNGLDQCETIKSHRYKGKVALISDLNKKTNDEFYIDFKKSNTGGIYYTYTDQFGVNQEWLPVDFIFNDKGFKIRTHKSGYIIKSLLNEDDGQPFLDRTQFSYLKPNSVIIGIDNKQTVLEHNKEKIIDIKIKDNKLILGCSVYLKNNAFDYPITSLCKNKNSILIFEEIK